MTFPVGLAQLINSFFQCTHPVGCKVCPAFKSVVFSLLRWQIRTVMVIATRRSPVELGLQNNNQKKENDTLHGTDNSATSIVRRPYWIFTGNPYCSKWRERKMELSLGRRRLPVHQGSCKRERSRNFSFIVGSLSLQHS